MKLRAILTAVLLAATGAARVHAAVEDCPAPTAEDEANGKVFIPAPTCKGPDYTTSFGAFPGVEQMVSATDMVSGSVPAPDTTGLPDGMTVVGEEPEVGGIQTDMNARQLMRLGELDAMQGRPLNMNHASDLGYMQGFTQGQQMRQQGRMGGGTGDMGW